MSRARPRPLHLMVLTQAMLCSSVAYGQLQPRLQRCLPYPTFAEEVDALKESTALDNPRQQKTIVIDYVIFDPPAGLSNSVREQALAELKQADSDVGPDSIAEVVRAAWQDQGYFKVLASADFRTIASDSSSRHVALTIHVDQGPQYFLGHLQIRSAHPDEPLLFSPDELRKLVPLQEGDVFEADKIRGSLEAMRQLYGSKGYIDFLAEPEFDVDDAHDLIGLTLEIDQGKQFHVRHIEVLGLDSATEKALRAKIEPGDVFDIDVLKQFFEENRSVLPSDASLEDVDLERDLKNGAVDMKFNFLTCPKPRE